MARRALRMMPPLTRSSVSNTARPLTLPVTMRKTSSSASAARTNILIRFLIAGGIPISLTGSRFVGPCRVRDGGDFGLGHCFLLSQGKAQNLHGFLWRIGKVEELQVFRRDGAVLYQRVEVDDFFAERRAIENDRHLLRQLLRLRKGQDLEELVHGSEAAGEDYQGFGQVGEPELTHEEIVELKTQLIADVRIGELFERQ